MPKPSPSGSYSSCRVPVDVMPSRYRMVKLPVTMIVTSHNGCGQRLRGVGVPRGLATGTHGVWVPVGREQWCPLLSVPDTSRRILFHCRTGSYKYVCQVLVTHGNSWPLRQELARNQAVGSSTKSSGAILDAAYDSGGRVEAFCADRQCL